MADISSITLPGGGTYDLKDKNAVPKYGMGKNLLDNWYFGNPVNQRGESSYTSSGYTIDRWKKYSGASTSGSVSLSAGGVVLTGSSSAFCMLRQDVNDYQRTLGKTVTISALTSAGLIQTTGTIPAELTSNYSLDLSFETGLIQYTLIVGTESYFGIRVSQGNTMTVYAVKLELGTQQTLAHLEGSTWVLNEIPDYEEELIKCQTSTADSTDTYANKSIATEQQLSYIEDSITMKYHGDSNLSTTPGTTSLINTGIKFTANTELILFKVHTSASGTLKININSASVIDMNMDNGQDYATFLVRTLTPGTELQVQYLGTSTANISSYYIVSIPLPGIGI